MITFIVASRNAHKVGEICAVLGAGARCLSLADLPPAPEVAEDAQTFAGNALKKARAVAFWLGTNMRGAFASGETFVMADDSGLEVDALDGEPGVRSARYASESGSGNAADAINNAKLLAALQSVPADARSARFRCAIAIVPVEDLRESGDEPGTGRVAVLRPTILNDAQCHLDRFMAPIHDQSLEAFPPPDSLVRSSGFSQPEPPEGGTPNSPNRDMSSPQEPTADGALIFEGKCEGLIALAPSGSGGFGYDPLFIPSGFGVSFAELGEDIKNRISHRARALDLVKDHLTLNNHLER